MYPLLILLRMIVLLHSCLFMCSCVEMAGHHKGGEVPSEVETSQHRGVPWLLPEGTHCMGQYASVYTPLCTPTHYSNIYYFKIF